MKIAEIVSRKPAALENNQLTACKIAPVTYGHHQANVISAVDWKSIKHYVSYDQECVSLSRRIKTGFPTSKKDLSLQLHSFWAMKDELYATDNVPFKEEILILKPL